VQIPTKETPILKDDSRCLLPEPLEADIHKKCLVLDLENTLIHSSFTVSELLCRQMCGEQSLIALLVPPVSTARTKRGCRCFHRV